MLLDLALRARARARARARVRVRARVSVMAVLMLAESGMVVVVAPFRHRKPYGTITMKFHHAMPCHTMPRRATPCHIPGA